MFLHDFLIFSIIIIITVPVQDKIIFGFIINNFDNY
jgi:hypothetical protein